MKALDEAELKISEALLSQTRMFAESPDPAVRIAAAKWEIRFSKQIQRIESIKATAALEESR